MLDLLQSRMVHAHWDPSAAPLGHVLGGLFGCFRSTLHRRFAANTAASAGLSKRGRDAAPSTSGRSSDNSNFTFQRCHDVPLVAVLRSLDGAGVLGPAIMGVAFSNAAGPDIVFAPFQFGLPPADFSTTWTTSVAHRQLLVASQLSTFPLATSMNLRVISIAVPGKTIGINGTLSGNCP